MTTVSLKLQQPPRLSSKAAGDLKEGEYFSTGMDLNVRDNGTHLFLKRTGDIVSALRLNDMTVIDLGATRAVIVFPVKHASITLELAWPL